MPPNTPITGAQTLHPDNVQRDFPQPDYSEAVKKYIQFRRQRLIAARDVRDMIRDEWDGMGFLQYMEVLKRHDDQYIAPRKNKQDTSINTGSIRDKDTTLVEYACKYSFEPVAQCFDDEDEQNEEMADTAEDLVRKSKLIESYKDKAKLIYRSMVSFGTALVEDLWVERWINEKIMNEDGTWSEKRVKQYDGCMAKLWDLRKCYFGDIRKFFMNGPLGQPYFFTVEYESYEMTKQLFGEWAMWKYVPNTIVWTPEVSTNALYAAFWTLRPVTLNYCEILRYYDPIMNEFAITINGIDMLPIQEKKTTENGMEKTMVSGYPLTEVSPSGAIPFAKYDLEPMHDFAYSKSQPGKMRVLADVENMFIKLMIGRLKQQAKPTLGNKSGRNFGQEVTEPGTVINDIRDGDLFPVLPNYQGPSQADFSMYELVKKELDKNSVERSFQGINNNAVEKTATQDINEQGAMSLKVASMFDGIISGENQLNWLRTYNIAKNWTKPIDTQIDTLKGQIIEKYRTVNLPSTADGGQPATKRIVFTPKTTMSSMDVAQEDINAKKDGKGEVRTAYLNPKMFRELKLNWYYSCVPVPNGSDPLSYMLFAKQIADATAFFGPDSLNVARLKHKFSALTGNDFDTWFISETEMQQKQQAVQAAQQKDIQNGGTGELPGTGAPGRAGVGASMSANPMSGMANIMKK
jgi:hypothetical protein